jgi:hypothetical protein
MRKLLAPAGLLVVLVTAGGCARSTEAEAPVTSAPSVASSTVAAPQSTADSAVSGWRVFTSVPGGYQLRYPPGWRVKESSGSGGPVLSLLPARGIGISVLVTSTAPPEGGAATAPNTRCQPVKVGGLEGSRCLDTVSMVVSTTLQGRERWYVLTTSLRRPAAAADEYDRVLASFRLT